MCRAFLSPWYEKGGMNPLNEKDKPIFEGRFNLGAVSLHLPMILAKARRESKDFYEVLNFYLEMIRGLHKRTFDYIGELRASVNPIGFCEGGFYGGNLNPNDKIKSILKPMTLSFGFTALNELQQLYNKKSLVEDGQFAIDVMKHINEKIEEFKNEDGLLYAIYATPAEALCFSGDTEIQTYNGNKKIKNIIKGDLVYSYNEITKKIELKTVLRSMQTNANAETVKVTFNNGQIIHCTPDHLFAKRIMIQNDKGHFIEEIIKYTKAKNLVFNDRIKSNYIVTDTNGHLKCTTHQFIHDINAEYFMGTKPNNCVVHHKNENHKVVSVEYEKNRIPVYDIEVEDNHNFYVGGDNGILVHNCGVQIKQFRKQFGIIENVSDKSYVSNSFHCHVTEDISPIEKQDLEGRFWELTNGGKIQYVRYPLGYNKSAIRTLVRRAMDKGFYEGVNLELSYCEDCGYQQVDLGDTCPSCKGTNITKISRMNGYLSYSRVKGDTRLNDAKMDEIADRKSM